MPRFTPSEPLVHPAPAMPAPAAGEQTPPLLARRRVLRMLPGIAAGAGAMLLLAGCGGDEDDNEDEDEDD